MRRGRLRHLRRFRKIEIACRMTAKMRTKCVNSMRYHSLGVVTLSVSGRLLQSSARVELVKVLCKIQNASMSYSHFNV